MSTNSTNQFSVEDDGSVTESPPQSTKKCTRTTPCSQPDCNGCSGTASIGHIRDLPDDLEVTTTTPTIPPNRWIIRMTKVFKVAIQEQDIFELEFITERYERDINAHLIDELNYDFTEIKKLNQDAAQLLANLSKPTPPFNHWIPTLTRWFKVSIKEQNTVLLEYFMDMYSEYKTKHRTDYQEYNLIELEQISRNAAKILNVHNRSQILPMQEITPETNTEHLIPRETKIQDIQVPRVYTTMDKDSDKGSIKHLQDEENPVKLKASPLETLQATQTSPTRTEEKPEVTTLTGKHSLNQVDDKLPEVNHSEAKDQNQLPQLVTINPEVKALPKLTTLNQEETDTSSNLITKPNPSAVQLHESSIHSGLWEHLAMFGVNAFPKFARKIAADLHLSDADTHLPSIPIQPALKPPWNLGRIGVH